jgi:redox-sensitive bicupin YhaK (pirin superfamily)
MANNKMLVEERQRDIGKFMVGRLLPMKEKRQVGPFTFIDHMGPAELKSGEYIDVDQHPHIGLSTLTYLFEGQIEHRDSTGAVQVISPGDVGFMSSGSGVSHTERTPTPLRQNSVNRMHGYQVWVALPKEMEEMTPRFDYVPAKELPTWEQDGMAMTLVAGEGFGHQSPLKVYSPLFMVDVFAKEAGALDIQGQLRGEIAIVVVHGEVIEDGEPVHAGQMMISLSEDTCRLELEAGTRLLIFGGQPLPEERYMFWNFVSSSRERIEQAKTDWREHRFPKVAGDDTYIPLP